MDAIYFLAKSKWCAATLVAQNRRIVFIAFELQHIISDKPITQPRRRSWRALELSRCFLFPIFLVLYFNIVYQTISLSPFNCKLFFKGAHMSARKTLRDRESQVTRRNLLSGF